MQDFNLIECSAYFVNQEVPEQERVLLWWVREREEVTDHLKKLQIYVPSVCGLLQQWENGIRAESSIYNHKRHAG